MELLDPINAWAINISSLRDLTTSILISRALVSPATALPTLTLITLIALSAALITLTALTTIPLTTLSLGLDLGSRHQTQLPIGHYLLAWFQSVFDHGHRVGGRAGLNDSYLDCLIKHDHVHE
jgi:hypothetical protein